MTSTILSAVASATSGRPRHPFSDISYGVIGAAIARGWGPGFPEKVYETALAIEFASQARPFVQAPLVAMYKGRPAGQFFADFLIDGHLVCEIKAVEALNEIHEAQVLNYLRTTNSQIGLLINFGEKTIRVRRLVRQLS